MASRKGPAFEREFADKLSQWWIGEGDRPVFWRTSQSGGRATTRRKKGKHTANQYGDICATDPIGQPFIDVVTLELKRGYSNFNIGQLLDKPNNKDHLYDKWFKKIEQTTKNAGSVTWMLVVRRDGRIPYVFIPKKFYALLNKAGCDVSKMVNCEIQLPYLTVYGTPLESFFEYVAYFHIKRILKKCK